MIKHLNMLEGGIIAKLLDEKWTNYGFVMHEGRACNCRIANDFYLFADDVLEAIDFAHVVLGLHYFWNLLSTDD